MNGAGTILQTRGALLRLALASTGFALALSILAVSILHWGGVYASIGSWLQMAGGGLWFVLALLAVLNFAEKKAVGDPVDLVVFVFLAYAGWRYATTPVEYTGRLEWLWILTYAALFFFMRYGLPSRHWAMVLLGLLIALAVVSCIYALIHRNQPTHLIWGLPRPNYGPRISGTFGCPNHFANLMVMAALTCLFVGSYSRMAWPLRIFLYYLAALLTAGLYFSVSRGGYLAWVTGMGVVAWFLFRTTGIRWWWKAAACVIVAAGAVFVVMKNPFVMDRIDGMMKGDIRQQLAVISIRLWEMNPVWGAGVGSYDFLYLRHHGPALQSRALYAHCDYFNTLVDYGAVGLGIILVFITCCIVEFRRRGKTGTHERDTLLVRLGWAALAAMAMHSVFDFSLHIPACAVAFFIILGASLMRTHREEKHLPGLRLPRPFLIVAAVLGVVLGGYTMRTAWITQSAMRGVPLKESEFAVLSVAEIDALGQRVFAVDPMAHPLLTLIGDALRVKAAQAHARWRKNPPGEETAALLAEREQAGRLSLMYYQRAHRAAPLEDTLLIKQGLILDILNRHVEAGLAYAQGVLLQPDNRYFRFHYGLHLLETGQRREAREQIRLAASMPLDPREDPTLRQTARVAMETLRSYESP